MSKELQTHFRELFDYAKASNEKVISLVKENPGSLSDEIHRLFSHILNAHEIWNKRILGETALYAVWEVHPYEKWKSINQQCFDQTMQIIESRDLTEMISCQNSRGDQFQNQIKDILFHVVNHGTYHRGQVMWLLRKESNLGISTDFIFYKR